MTPESFQIILLAAIALVSGIATPIAVAFANRITNKKLDVIHTLVNSNMTAAMQSEFDSMTRELATATELVDLKILQGKKPTTEVTESMAITKAKLVALRKVLDERQEKQRLIDAEAGK